MNQYIGIGVVILIVIMWVAIIAVNMLGSFIKDIVKAVLK